MVLGVEVPNAAEGFGVSLRGIESFQPDDLIAAQSGGSVDRLRRQAGILQIGFGPDHKDGLVLMDTVETGEIEIPSVHHINGSGFENQVVQDIDVVNFSFGDANKDGKVPAQIHQGMELDCGFSMTKSRPRKERETKIDRRGIEGINRLVEFETERVVGIKSSGMTDEGVSQVGIDMPIALFVGFGQRGTRDAASESDVIQFVLHGAEAGFDIAQAFSECQLSKSHTEILIHTRKRLHFVMAAIAFDASVEFVLR